MEARIEIGEHKDSRRGTSGGFGQALWLARTDIRKSWISFPVANLTAVLPGLYLIVLYSGVFSGPADSFTTFSIDFWFLIMVTILNVNFLFNRDYYYRLDADNYTKRLSFLRGLPITSRAVVGGRAMYMSLALVFNALPFFLAPYLADSSLRSVIGPLDYAWFVGMWIGYALFMMGFLLFMWNGLSFQTEVGRIFWIFPGWCLLIATISNFTLEGGLTVALMQIAKVQGPLAALMAVALGGIGLVLWMKLAESRLGRRELG